MTICGCDRESEYHTGMWYTFLDLLLYNVFHIFQLVELDINMHQFETVRQLKNI